MCRIVESVYCTSITNITLYLICNGIKIEKVKKKNKELCL